MELCDARIVVHDAVRVQGVLEQPPVGAARHRDRAERVGHAEQLFERARHRTSTGATGEHKRTVNVEKEECRRVVQSVSLFAPNVAGPRALRRRFFLE